MAERAVLNPGRKVSEGLGDAMHVVKHGESGHRGALGDELQVVRRPGRGCHVSVLRDPAAHDDAGLPVDLHERSIERLASDIVEVDVDAGWDNGFQQLGDGSGLVVDRCVEAQHVGEIGALRWATGDPDHVGSLSLRDLRGDTADRT